MADEDVSPIPPPAEEPSAPAQETISAPTTPEIATSEPAIETPPAEPQTAQLPVNEPLTP